MKSIKFWFLGHKAERSILFLECSGDCKVSVTLQTQVPPPPPAGSRVGSELDRAEQEAGASTCLPEDTHSSQSNKKKKKTETPGWVTPDHRSDPLQVAAAALGVEALTQDNISPDLFDKPA